MHQTDELILDYTHKLAETLTFIVTQTRQILNADYVDILFQYADGLRVEISSDAAETGSLVPFDRSISGLVLDTGDPVRVNDLQSDPGLRDRYYPRVKMDARERPPRLSVLAARLTLDQQTIGVINVEATDTRYEEAHLEFVTGIAGHISMAITHATLFDEDAFRTDTDRLLFASPPGGGDTIMHQVLERIVDALDSLAFVHTDAAEILFPEAQEGNSLTVAYSTNNADIGVRVDMDSSICGEAFRRGETVVLQRAAERSDMYRPVFPDMRCEMAIPIFFGGNDRFPLGVLNLESIRENAFSTVGQALAERFTQRVVNHVAITKLRADIDTELQDQFRMLAADQWHNSVHRINNYVGSVRAIMIELIEQLGEPGLPDKDELITRLTEVLGDAEKALEIPQDMRRRIDAPQESLDVNEQVRNGITAVVPMPRHIELVTDLTLDLPNVPCTALELVVENLLTNAVKAIREPGQLHVRTWIDDRLPREPFVVLTVRDTGVGMDPDELARLFEPRRTGHRGGGLGFGMMWVRNWVRRAQGLIDVESVPSEGTTVNIRFQVDPQLVDHGAEGGEPA
ncbi:MAG: GAF domain-containing protein [Streptosporangiaceae bacterium]|jgi:nitrogen-specific signal transduction histidine kinase